jgi:hypothetical protein
MYISRQSLEMSFVSFSIERRVLGFYELLEAIL